MYKSNKETFEFILGMFAIVIMLTLAFIGLIGIIEKNIERTEENIIENKINAPIEEAIDKELLVEFKKGFMSECDPFRDQTEYCECGYDEMAKKYSMKEIMQISNKLDDGEVPDELLEIFFECYNKVDWSK